MAKKRTRGDARKRRHLRIRKKVFGTSDRPRLNVFRSLNEIYVQVIDDTRGHTLISASTVDKEIKKKFKGMTKKEQKKNRQNWWVKPSLIVQKTKVLKA